MSELVLSNDEHKQLRAWLSEPTTPARIRLRAGIVLALAAGLSDREVARQQSVARQTVALWRRRVTEKRSALTISVDAPGRGRKPSVSEAMRQAVCAAYRRAAHAGRPRSVRDLAREFSLSPATVHRALRAGLGDDAPRRPAAGGRGGSRAGRRGGNEDGRSSSPEV